MVNRPNSDTLNTRHTVRKASRSRVLALAHSHSNCLDQSVFSLQRERKSRARTTSGPGDRITPNMDVLHFFFSLFFFWSPLFFLLFHKRRSASAPQIAVMFWVMISSLLWLSCPAARQSGMGKRNKIKHLKNNTQVIGETSRTPGHTSQWWREDKADRQQQKRCCLAVFATYFLLVYFSLLLFAPIGVWGGDLKLNS